MTSAFVDGMNIKIQQPEQKAWPHVQRKVSLLLSQSCKPWPMQVIRAVTHILLVWRNSQFCDLQRGAGGVESLPANDQRIGDRHCACFPMQNGNQSGRQMMKNTIQQHVHSLCRCIRFRVVNFQFFRLPCSIHDLWWCCTAHTSSLSLVKLQI